MSADIKIFTDDIEGQALNQCYTIAESPVFETARIRIMPDVHAGKGCVTGFTATGMTKLIPNLVGVDIGCGMLTARLDTKAFINVRGILRDERAMTERACGV